MQVKSPNSVTISARRGGYVYGLTMVVLISKMKSTELFWPATFKWIIKQHVHATEDSPIHQRNKYACGLVGTLPFRQTAEGCDLC